MPTPKQLSTARHRKNTQRRSFPRQRKTHLFEEGLYQKTLSKKRVALSPAFLLPRRQSCLHIDHILALRRGLKGSPRRKEGILGTQFASGAPPCSHENKAVFRVFCERPGSTAEHGKCSGSTAEQGERSGSTECFPRAENTRGAPRSMENAPGTQNASPEQRTLGEHRGA